MNDHDRNVYILGAGFSHTAGIPLMGNFLDEARKMWSDVFFTSYKKIFEYQDRLTPSFRNIIYDIDNLEELFGLLDLNISVAEDEEKNNLLETRKVLIDMISHVIEMKDKTKARSSGGIGEYIYGLGVFNVKKQNLSKSLEEGHYRSNPPGETHVDIDSYMYFAGLITGLMRDSHPDGLYNANVYKDTVISFNYDLVLDRVLDQHIFPLAIDYVVNREYFSIVDKNCNNQAYRLPRVKLLKMHGSIGFKKCESCGIIVADNNKAPDKCVKCEMDLSNNPSLILPPTWNKTDHRESILNIWKEGYNELANARRIIIIGYSFPETDIFFKHLLAVSLSQNKKLEKFIVVDPSEKVGEKYRSMMNPNFKERNFEYIPQGFPSVFSSGFTTGGWSGNFLKLIDRTVQ